LYSKVAQQLRAKDPASGIVMGLYVLLFPGQAKHNTGIKDLNDKILGYELNQQYIRHRQEQIRQLFSSTGGGFVVVGQDYKTASILAPQTSRREFAKRLAQLDAVLKGALLDKFLPAAETQAKSDKERLARIKDLRNALNRDKNYRFDIFFGLSTVQAGGKISPIDMVFLLVTEALKGAGLSKVIAKGASLKTQAARRFTKDLKADDAALDSRGKEYGPRVYLDATTKAGDIKALMTRTPNRDNPANYFHIWVNKVWTTAFFKYRRWYVGNPDVIRDVRKNLLEKPRARDGNIKFYFKEQKELLELWIVFLNMLDFVKDFLSIEFRQQVVAYHDAATATFRELVQDRPVSIDWPRLERVLTKDSRQTERIAVLGTASEFQFYSAVADYPARIFFSMDIRDLGVALMLLYEYAGEEIEHYQHTHVKLMEETIKASDLINRQVRFTYDSVVGVFKKYYGLVGKSQSAAPAAAARQAFGVEIGAIPLPAFDECVQIMLGGDEVFVAAHPYFALFIPAIISDLDNIALSAGMMNVRTAVSYSRVAGGRPPRVDVQASHQKALSSGAWATNVLKPLERLHRRIERLIDKLEANPKKKDSAPQFRKELEALRLTKMFARVRHGKAAAITASEFRRVVLLLRGGDLRGAITKGGVELVDFDGKVVNADTLDANTKRLLGNVEWKVGADNKHADPLPVTKMPKWMEKLMKWLEDEAERRDKEKEREKQRQKKQ
jgi:hypothetical protein